MSRRHVCLQEDFPLPWPVEVGLWVFGLMCVPLGMWWFINEITSPAETLGAILGVSVDTQGIIGSAQPLIWLFGFLVGVRVRCWLRRIVVHQLNRAFLS